MTPLRPPHAADPIAHLPTDDVLRPPPDRIGPYHIQGRLGVGGMGTVYLAEQVAPVRRQVALKVIRSRHSTEEGRIRFETERQAMARLQHPNVAQIFEAATTDDGHPYFVMERVDGVSITEYCEAKRLTIAERLRLFRGVCAGVHHAHQKGIIHRDLKPSNVLVAEDDGAPVAKIIDFGIAKTFGDDELDTGSQVTGDRMIGTPAYLSPEAAHLGQGTPLDLDTRSDIYSLGILLYELIAGFRPFEGEALFELPRKINEDEAPSPYQEWRRLEPERRQQLAEERHGDPTSIAHQLRGDLEWIVLKAIAKDRRNRYDSAAALAADLGRHLRHEPVEAGPPSRLYRLRKFVRRRAGVVVGLAAVALALALGLLGRTLEAERANREKRAAIAARLETEAALEEAERARAEAAEVSAFLVDLFKVSDPRTTRGDTPRGDRVTARELLDQAASQVREDLDDQPAARARFMQTIADIYRKLGLLEPAEALASESVALRRRHLPPGHPDLAASLTGLAATYAAFGRFEDAAPLLEEALEIRRRALGQDHAEFASTLNDLGNVYSELGREAEAAPLYRRSIEINRRRGGTLEPEHLVAMNNLAVYYSGEGEYDEAEPLLRDFLRQIEALHGRDHVYAAFALENLADVRGHQGATGEALEHFAEAEAILVETLGEAHPEVAYCRRIRGDLLGRAGRADEAERDYRSALEIQRAALPADHPEIRATLDALEALGRPAG